MNRTQRHGGTEVRGGGFGRTLASRGFSPSVIPAFAGMTVDEGRWRWRRGRAVLRRAAGRRGFPAITRTLLTRGRRCLARAICGTSRAFRGPACAAKLTALLRSSVQTVAASQWLISSSPDGSQRPGRGKPGSAHKSPGPGTACRVEQGGGASRTNLLRRAFAGPGTPVAFSAPVIPAKAGIQCFRLLRASWACSQRDHECQR